MNKLFAVSHINWHNHELQTLIIEADDWREAAIQHPKIAEGFSLEEDECKETLPQDQEYAKELAFDQDMMIEIVEIEQE